MAWADIIADVCTVDDVLKAVHDIDGITLEGAEDAAAEDATILQRLNDAKNELRQELFTKAVETFRNNSWWRARSRTDLADILDSIKNANEFKGYLVARTIEKLYLYGETVIAAGLDFEERKEKRKTWIDEARKLYDLAYPLIWFDISGDDISSDDEKTVTTIYSFTRV